MRRENQSTSRTSEFSTSRSKKMSTTPPPILMRVEMYVNFPSTPLRLEVGSNKKESIVRADFDVGSISMTRRSTSSAESAPSDNAGHDTPIILPGRVKSQQGNRGIIRRGWAREGRHLTLLFLIFPARSFGSGTKCTRKKGGCNRSF